MNDKALIWLGSSLEDVRAFPEDARKIAGHQLRRVQQGLEPNSWKPMPSVGQGVKEIRIHTGLEHRLLYIAKFREGIYILHAFEKRSRTTPKHEIDLAKRRFGHLLEERPN